MKVQFHESEDYAIHSYTPPLGYYDWGGCRVYVTHKPNAFQRLMIRWCFGWKFVEVK